MAEIMLFDTHCHLDFSQFDEDRDAVFARMRQAEVQRIVAVAVEMEQYDRLKKLAQTFENVWFSVGVHPNHEVEAEPNVAQLLQQAEHPRCVAIGETGMDFFRHRVTVETQEARFRTHLEAARICGKPVIVHMREADATTIRILREEDVHRGIMHCFSSTKDVAAQALDLGMYISFSGNVTFKRNDDLRKVAAYVPADRLLVETDAPYLAPMPHRGKRNEPAFVRHVASCIADVRGTPLHELARQTTANACRVFGINQEDE